MSYADPLSEMTLQTRSQGDVRIIEIGGHIAEVAADRINTLIGQLVQQGVAKFVFDLTGVKFLSSTGLGQIMHAYRTATSQGGYVRIVNPQPLIADVFSVTKLDRILGIYPSVDAALAEDQGDEEVPLR